VAPAVTPQTHVTAPAKKEEKVKPIQPAPIKQEEVKKEEEVVKS
jgi:hypothetical protein